MANEDGNADGGDSKPDNGAHACPVWVSGGCNGQSCNCPEGGGGR